MAVDGNYVVEGVSFATPSQMAMISPISSQASALPTFASGGSAGAGFTVQPMAVHDIVSTNSSTISSAGSTADQLGQQSLSPASFGTFGSSVGSASTALQSALTSSLSSIVQLLTAVNQSVGTAAQSYSNADNSVANSYGGVPTSAFDRVASMFSSRPMAKTPPHKGPGGPGNEGPLPAHGTQQPNLHDFNTRDEMRAAVMYFRWKGWNTAGDALQHYLDNTGTDFVVAPHQMTQDMPKFDSTVNDVLTAHRGQGAFDTGWRNTDDILPKPGAPKGAPESLDWYYTTDNFRYRVSGTSALQPDGSTVDSYSVDVYKPYIFGSPRGDITVPYVGKTLGWKIDQDSIQDLNTTGLARNFNIVGSEHYTRITPAPAR